MHLVNLANLVNLMASPITEVTAQVSRYVEAIVKASSLNNFIDTGSAVLFTAIALTILFIKFWLDITEENIKRKGADQLAGVVRSLRFLGMRLFIVPLIIAATAIPHLFYGLTPNAYYATGLVAKRVALVGDNLVTAIDAVYSLHVARQVDGTVAASVGDSHEKQLIKQTQANYNRTNSDFRAIANEVKELEATRTLNKGAGNTVTGRLFWNAEQDKKLAEAVKRRDIAKKALDDNSKAYGKINGAIRNKVDAAKSLAELETARELHAAAKTDAPGKSFWSRLGENVVNAEIAGDRSILPDKTGADGMSGIVSGIASIFIFVGKICSFVLRIGFYLCLLPAFIGLIAGAIVCLKEALGLLQYGAKLEIIKNLTFGVATIFAPLFMLGFLFAKTEQFAWKFITLMFSMYFGFFALSYASAVLIGPGLSQIGNIMSQLTTLSVSQYGEQASLELFSESVSIGLKGLGVGMIAAFLLDVVKSAIAVGHSLIGGNFSVSS